jgi:hypothetical protein
MEIVSVARPRIVYSAKPMFLQLVMTESQCLMTPCIGFSAESPFYDMLRHFFSFFSPGIRNLNRIACGYMFRVRLNYVYTVHYVFRTETYLSQLKFKPSQLRIKFLFYMKSTNRHRKNISSMS